MLFVENVEPAGWSSLAGLRQGDLLLTVNGNAVGTVDDFVQEINACSKENSPHVIFFIKRGIHTLFIKVEPNSILPEKFSFPCFMIKMKNPLYIIFIFLGISVTVFAKKDPRAAWTKLLNEPTDYVTWVSVVVKIEVSSNGRSFPATERKLEALGTVLELMD